MTGRHVAEPPMIRPSRAELCAAFEAWRGYLEAGNPVVGRDRFVLWELLRAAENELTESNPS